MFIWIFSGRILCIDQNATKDSGQEWQQNKSFKTSLSELFHKICFIDKI